MLYERRYTSFRIVDGNPAVVLLSAEELTRDELLLALLDGEKALCTLANERDYLRRLLLNQAGNQNRNDAY